MGKKGKGKQKTEGTNIMGEGVSKGKQVGAAGILWDQVRKDPLTQRKRTIALYQEK